MGTKEKIGETSEKVRKRAEDLETEIDEGAKDIKEEIREDLRTGLDLLSLCPDSLTRIVNSRPNTLDS
ncbi:MAG: hypothetical protein JXB14_06580 [Candidatus Altiarchaeota archaeon]|nr:hypothetical protein [Candidatus Altiarchaeota archaeon]